MAHMADPQLPPLETIHQQRYTRRKVGSVPPVERAERLLGRAHGLVKAGHAMGPRCPAWLREEVRQIIHLLSDAYDVCDVTDDRLVTKARILRMRKR